MLTEVDGRHVATVYLLDVQMQSCGWPPVDTGKTTVTEVQHRGDLLVQQQLSFLREVQVVTPSSASAARCCSRRAASTSVTLIPMRAGAQGPGGAEGRFQYEGAGTGNPCTDQHGLWHGWHGFWASLAPGTAQRTGT